MTIDTSNWTDAQFRKCLWQLSLISKPKLYEAILLMWLDRRVKFLYISL